MAYDIVFDADAQTYVTDHFNGRVDFGGDPLVSDLSSEAVLAKYGQPNQWVPELPLTGAPTMRIFPNAGGS